MAHRREENINMPGAGGARGQLSSGQAQMNRDELISETQNYGQANDFFQQMNPPSSNIHNYGQDTNFLHQTGDQVKTMAHGAADIASGAAKGAASIAQGAATGAANMAQGAADAMKKTFGMNPTGGYSEPSELPTTTTHHHPTNNPHTRI